MWQLRSVRKKLKSPNMGVTHQETPEFSYLFTDVKEQEKAETVFQNWLDDHHPGSRILHVAPAMETQPSERIISDGQSFRKAQCFSGKMHTKSTLLKKHPEAVIL